MKQFFNKIVIITFLIIIINSITHTIMNGENSGDLIFFVELIACVVLICICQFVSNKFKSRYYLLELLVEYVMVCVIVASCGLIFAWFNFDSLWRVFVYVTPVYIVTYFLGIARTKKEVDDINTLIRLRNERKQNHE